MKKIQRFSEMYWVLGMVFVALGVALCSKADLGVSMIAAPAFILSEFLLQFWSFASVGVTEYLFQGVLLILLCIIVRRFKLKYIFSFVVAFLYGNLLDLWLLILGEGPFNYLWMRWVFLFVGDACTAFGVACFFRTYLPLQVYELLVAEIADKFMKKIEKTKLVYDLTSLVVSILLAFLLYLDATSFDWSKIYGTSYHCLGIGTLITTLINAPLITFWGRLLDKIALSNPIFSRAERFFKK